MNSNKTIEIIAKVAPPLLLVAVAGLAIKSLFSGDEKKLEAKPASKMPEKSTVVPIIPPISVSAGSKIPSPTLIPADPILDDLPLNMPSQKRRIVLREDLARIFRHGTRSLYRIDAVAELQKLGFGKTAAYEALSPDGRFASWLKIAPDGIINLDCSRVLR
jgi:hypothetical protein